MAVDVGTVDLEVVIGSHRDERWLDARVDSPDAPAGRCAFRATVVENGGSAISLAEGTSRRVLYMENLGFAAANNEGARDSTAEFLLFQNPDTELRQGTLELLVESMRNRPEVGLLGTRQVTSDGRLSPSLHRFPSVRRGLAQALASERWPGIGKRLGERVLELETYTHDGPFDWATGAVPPFRPSGPAPPANENAHP